MATVELKTKEQLFLDSYTGVMYLLFYTQPCGSCRVTMEKLNDIIKDAEFCSENLIIVPRDYSIWIAYVKRFAIRGYPSLVKTYNGKKVDIYTGENIIRVFLTGLKT